MPFSMANCRSTACLGPQVAAPSANTLVRLVLSVLRQVGQLADELRCVFEVDDALAQKLP
jgi:hypothetical protein